MLARFAVQILVNALCLWLVAQVFSGIQFDGNLLSLLVLGMIFGIVNAIIKPVLMLLTLPLTVITLGLFALVVNALMLMLTSWLYPGYTVDGFWTALWAGILISVVSTLINFFIPD